MKHIASFNIIFTLLTFILTASSCTSESMEADISLYEFQGSWNVTGLSHFLPPENREYKNAYMELLDSGQLRLILVYKKERSEIFWGSWEITNSKLNIHIPDLLQKSFYIDLKSSNAFELRIDQIGDLYFARIIDSYLDKYKDSENFPDNDNGSNNGDDEGNEEEGDEKDPFMPSISVSQKTVNFSYEGGECQDHNVCREYDYIAV